MCGISFPDKEYESIVKTWYQWYEELASGFYACSPKRRSELLFLWKDELEFYSKRICDDIHVIDSMKLVEESEGIYDEKMKGIIAEIRRAFDHFNIELYSDRYLQSGETSDCDWLFRWLNAVNNSVKKSIDNWIDIAFYNDYMFETKYELGLDKKKMTSACIVTVKRLQDHDEYFP